MFDGIWSYRRDESFKLFFSRWDGGGGGHGALREKPQDTISILRVYECMRYIRTGENTERVHLPRDYFIFQVPTEKVPI